MLSFLRARSAESSPRAALRDAAWDGRRLRLTLEPALAHAEIALDLDGCYFSSARANEAGHLEFAFPFAPRPDATLAAVPRTGRNGAALIDAPIALTFAR